jgi:uncharacterized protein (TIGR02594 family)
MTASLESREHWPPWLALADQEVGVREVIGPADNPRILEYHSAAPNGMPPSDEMAWCSAFACWVMEQAGYKSTRSKAARSWLRWGDELKEPKLGCIAVLWRGTPQGTAGHVGFYVDSGGRTNTVTLLSGNSGNSVSYATYASARVLGYRWPAARDLKAA